MYGIWHGSTSFAKDTAWLKKPWWPWECASQLSGCLRHLGSLSVQGLGSCTLKFSLLLVPMSFPYTAPCHSSRQGYWGEHVPGRCRTPLMSNFGLKTHWLPCLTFLGTARQSEMPPHSLTPSLTLTFLLFHPLFPAARLVLWPSDFTSSAFSYESSFSFNPDLVSASKRTGINTITYSYIVKP